MKRTEQHIKPLVTFLKKIQNRKEQEAFAARCGTSLAYLRLVMYGQKRPSADFALRIAEQTGWAITPNQIRPITFRNPHDGLPVEHHSNPVQDNKLNNSECLTN